MQQFMLVAPNVNIQLGVSGTGGGFKKFCAGITDISNASRPIKPDEREICRANGIEFVEAPVAFDGISVIVNRENTWTQCMTVDELKRMWAPESEGVVTTWRQIRADWLINHSSCMRRERTPERTIISLRRLSARKTPAVTIISAVKTIMCSCNR